MKCINVHYFVTSFKSKRNTCKLNYNKILTHIDQLPSIVFFFKLTFRLLKMSKLKRKLPFMFAHVLKAIIPMKFEGSIISPVSLHHHSLPPPHTHIRSHSRCAQTWRGAEQSEFVLVLDLCVISWFVMKSYSESEQKI